MLSLTKINNYYSNAYFAKYLHIPQVYLTLIFVITKMYCYLIDIGFGNLKFVGMA